MLQLLGLFASLALPLAAMEVSVSPNPAQLGDTLTVTTTTTEAIATPPQVSLGSDTYPSFEVAPGRYRTLVPTSPLTPPGALTLSVSHGSDLQRLNVPLSNRDFPLQHITLSNDSSGGGWVATDREIDAVTAFKEVLSPIKLWQGAFSAPSTGEVSSIYGVRRTYNGELATDYYHRGVDYAAPTGAPVVAPAGGVVVLVGNHNEGFVVHGNTVGLDHGQGVTSIFLHLSSIDVQEGDTVQAGDLIGRIGTTGASTGPHLHWGLYVHGIAVDPVPWRYTGIE